MTSEQIQRNIRARKEAEAVLDLAQESFDITLMDSSRFWQVIADYAAEKINKHVVDNVDEMMEVQALAFEKTEMPYGKYAGIQVGNIAKRDNEYLPWIAENSFATDLKRYLRSKHYRKKYHG